MICIDIPEEVYTMKAKRSIKCRVSRQGIHPKRIFWVDKRLTA